MTPLIFQDEVFLDCSKDLNTSECTFTFKGKEIYLRHTLEVRPKQQVHRMTCKVDGQTFHFGTGRSTLGAGSFGTRPRIEIEGHLYCFRIKWPMGEGQKGIHFETENKIKNRSFVLKDNTEAKNQEELDDIEGYLHIHTLPPERRKQIIEQMKNKEK